MTVVVAVLGVTSSGEPGVGVESPAVVSAKTWFGDDVVSDAAARDAFILPTVVARVSVDVSTVPGVVVLVSSSCAAAAEARKTRRSLSHEDGGTGTLMVDRFPSLGA